MEWFKIKTTTMLMRVAVDEIVYVKADGNYCDLVLINGQSCKMTFQLHFFEQNFQLLQNANYFIRVGRSLIVNRNFVRLVDLMEQKIVFGGKHLEMPPANPPKQDIYTVKASREALRILIDKLC